MHSLNVDKIKMLDKLMPSGGPLNFNDGGHAGIDLGKGHIDAKNTDQITPQGFVFAPFVLDSFTKIHNQGNDK